MSSPKDQLTRTYFENKWDSFSNDERYRVVLMANVKNPIGVSVESWKKLKPSTRSKIVDYWLQIPDRSGVEVMES